MTTRFEIAFKIVAGLLLVWGYVGDELWEALKKIFKRSKPDPMQSNTPQEIFGTEHCNVLASDFLHYSWRSDCGTHQFHSSAANVEAARAKLQRHFEPKGIIPRFNRN